jgi:hypothetical protein
MWFSKSSQKIVTRLIKVSWMVIRLSYTATGQHSIGNGNNGPHLRAGFVRFTHTRACRLHACTGWAPSGGGSGFATCSGGDHAGALKEHRPRPRARTELERPIDLKAVHRSQAKRESGRIVSSKAPALLRLTSGTVRGLITGATRTAAPSSMQLGTGPPAKARDKAFLLGESTPWRKPQGWKGTGVCVHGGARTTASSLINLPPNDPFLSY